MLSWRLFILQFSRFAIPRGQTISSTYATQISMQGTKLEIPKETVEELAGHLSDTQAARKLGIAVSSFFLLRKRYGVQSFTRKTGCRRSLEDGRLLMPGTGTRHPQHQDLDVDCFESIDSEEKAYFLGLLATDGHIVIGDRGKYVSIELQEPDCNVLSGLGRLLRCPERIQRIERSGKKPSGRFRVYSRELAESLVRRGISTRTEEHVVPRDLPPHLRPHCLRGILDGDGHICSRKKSLYLCSCSHGLIEVVAGWVKEGLGLALSRKERILPSGKAFHVVTFGGGPRKVLAWAYGGSSVGIARKKAEADLWLSSCK